MSRRNKRLIIGTILVIVPLAVVFLSKFVLQGASSVPKLNAIKVTTPPMLDGDASDAVWQTAPELKVTINGSWATSPVTVAGQGGGTATEITIPWVKLKALYTDTTLYVLATWPDSDLSITRGGGWDWTGTAWTKHSGQAEDRLAFWWPINVPKFESIGCRAKCHMPDAHPDCYTAGCHMKDNHPSTTGLEDECYVQTGERADKWHMKAARFLGVKSAAQSGVVVVNPTTHEVTGGKVTLIGYCDDKHTTEYVADKDGGRRGDSGSGATTDNRNAIKTSPKYMESNPDNYIDAMILTQTEINNGETIIVDTTGVTGAYAGDDAVTSAWSKYSSFNACVPENILKEPSGSRGNIEQAATWENGIWTSEFKRALLTSTTDQDVQFSDLTKEYSFAVAVMDNSGGEEHFWQKDYQNLVFVTLTPAARIVENVVAYPSPFNPKTGLLKFANVPADATIEIYTLTGELVYTLENPTSSAIVEWDGKNEDGKIVARGIYIYRVKSGGDEVRGKFAVVK